MTNKSTYPIVVLLFNHQQKLLQHRYEIIGSSGFIAHCIFCGFNACYKLIHYTVLTSSHII